MAGFSFRSSSASSSSQSTPAFSLSNPTSTGLAFGSSAPAFGSAATTTSSSPFGMFGSSISTSSSSPAPFLSIPFNSASSSAASLFGTGASSSSATSVPSPFGTISSAATSATSGFASFATASSASIGFSRFGTSSAPPFSSSTTVFASSSSSASTTPAFSFASMSASSSSSAPAFGDGGVEVECEVVKKSMSPNSVEETMNDSAAAASASESAHTSPLSSLCVEVDRHVTSAHNVPIIKRILQKYGNITNGSRLKSLDAKFAFLDLMADVVNQLCSHSLETLSSHELQLMEEKVDDALAVGFSVEWLQQRVGEIKAAKCQACSKELDELDQQIEAAKTSLMEMELRREDLAKDVAAIKANTEEKGLLGFNLSEGLL